MTAGVIENIGEDELKVIHEDERSEINVKPILPLLLVNLAVQLF